MASSSDVAAQQSAAKSVYSQRLAADNNPSATVPLSFATMGSAVSGDTPTARSSPGYSEWANEAGWKTVSLSPTESALTYTTVTLKGQVQTLAASAAAVEATTASSGLSSNEKVAIGAGVGVGGAALLFLLAAAWILRKRKQDRRDFENRTRNMRMMTQTPSQA